MGAKFFTNRDNNTLIKEFEGIISDNPHFKNLDAVVGFLRSSGYFALRPFLDTIDKVRILIGIDVDKYIVKAETAGRLFIGAEEDVKEDFLQIFKTDIEHANYTKEVEKGIFQVVEDLLSGKLELRVHPSKKIHAKIYILYPEPFGTHSQGAAITGSSNLSGNGLGITNDRQYEFNVLLEDHEQVAFAKDEFEQLWQEAKGCEITATDIETTIKKTYLKGDATPYELYIKMLMEYFSDRVLETDNGNPFDMPEGYIKFDYQMDAVIEGYQKLLRYDGFFLADVVGLGKTVVATMIAKKFLIENGRDKTKILVVYPPAVEQNWKTTFKDFEIDKYTKFITNGSLSKVLDEDDYNYWKAEEYDLVLVDEAHKFRSHTTAAFVQLQEICKMPRVQTGNIAGYKKKVMLISATPTNNSLADIYNQILLFQDPRHCTIDGVANLTAFFAPLIKKFKTYRKEDSNDLEKIKQLSERVRERIIKPLTVRRTRSDIQNVPRYFKEVQSFPVVERPIGSYYKLNERLADLFEQTMQTLNKKLTYARYKAIAYLKDEANKGRYDNAELISYSLAGIRKNGLVKRLESSFYAFQVSLNNFRQANQNMIEMFESDKVYIAPDLDINNLMASCTEEELEERLNAKAENNPKNAIFKADDFKPEFIEMLRSDQEILNTLYAEWKDITPADDSKFAKFNELLKHEFFKTNRNPEQKLVVFSESVDTVNYLASRINRNDVLVISAKNRNALFKTIRENFDANYNKEKKNTYNIILTTDVLAEGVNLHRANVIVNYDTPWNATRLMQRIGRVNRIGSSSKHIYNYVFYPSREGNREINLNQIVLSKIQTFHTTFGEDYQIYSRDEILDRNLDKLFDEEMKAQQEEQNKEIPFYEELRTLYHTNRKEYNRIAKISLRSRTGRAARTVNGVTLSGDTLVFLKTNVRKLFFLVSENAEEISVIDALTYFKAEPEEQPVERIAQHHNHVNRALKKFRAIQNEGNRYLEMSREEQGNMGAQVTTAVSLLNSFMREIQDQDIALKVAQLKTLAERGVITYIAKRLQRIQKNIRRIGSKARMTHDEALSEIIDMANKYNKYFVAEEARNNQVETNAEIILSESFQ